MRVRVRNANNVALILEDQDMVDLVAIAEISVLGLPRAEQILNLR